MGVFLQKYENKYPEMGETLSMIKLIEGDWKLRVELVKVKLSLCLIH
jgi:hypothetical protein